MSSCDKYINSTTTHYISNSGSDENGSYTGGKAGDQTGNEWCLKAWYSRPWNCVLRYPDQTVGTKIAEMACLAALNDKIGYDQNQRLTFWNELEKVGYDPSKIATACEEDCSAGVCSIIKAVGYIKEISALKNIQITSTHYMREILKAAGFQELNDYKYVSGTDYLLPGDVLLNIQHHTAINVTKGRCINSTVTQASATVSKSATITTNYTIANAESRDISISGQYKVTASSLNLRYVPGVLTDSNIITAIPKNDSVWCYAGYYTKVNGVRWLYVAYGSKIGYVSEQYLQKVG